MKRLIYIISTYLILAGMYSGTVCAESMVWIYQNFLRETLKIPTASSSSISNQAKSIYLQFGYEVSSAYTSDFALAKGSNGWAAGIGRDRHDAQRNALSNCTEKLKFKSCKIVDVNGTSDLFKQKTKQVVSTTSDQPDRTLAATGTGFAVDHYYIVTAAHVVSECGSVSIRHSHKEILGEVAATDSINDLALIRLNKPFKDKATLRSGQPIRKGESISNYGYPLFGQLSDTAKITQGNVNSLAGWKNDSRVIQIDAATQPGNSGGPILDTSGNVVGVLSSALGRRYVEQSGILAQNVNFGVKSFLVEAFLSANDVSYEKAESTEELKLPDIAEKAERFTVLVGCWE